MKSLVFLLPLFSFLHSSFTYQIHTTRFKFPPFLPTHPKGNTTTLFATGIITMGPLQLRQASTFTPLTPPQQHTLSFFRPRRLPRHFHRLGYLAQPDSVPFSGALLLAKELTPGALQPPSDYAIVANLTSLNSTAYFWSPLPPPGYKAMGHVVTSTPSKPSLQHIRCVLSNLTEPCLLQTLLPPSPHISIFSLKHPNGAPAGTFMAATNKTPSTDSIACFKNNAISSSAAPDDQKLKALIKAYSPVFHFHPSEEFLPSSVVWFFSNGAMLYTKSDINNPSTISPSGENLPVSTVADDTHWIDLPTNKTAMEIVKKGCLDSAEAYLNVKQMLGGTVTDITFWIFYPFNGPAAIRFKRIYTLKLETVGEHVGDWEHVTLRISNFNGGLQSVFFSQHGGGRWVDASQLEFQKTTNKPVVYVTLHGHAALFRAGELVLGRGLVKVWSEGRGGGGVMDTGLRGKVIGGVVKEEKVRWVEYMGRWGPKHSYRVMEEMEKVLEKVVPKWLRKKAMAELPKEVIMEEGPFGPKAKNSWYGDEAC